MSGLLNKTARIAARGMYRSALPKLKESMVSFAFDDCPASAITTAVPMLEAAGWRATIYVACGLCDTTNHLGRHMSQSDIVEMHQRGHEIADHTFSHLSAHVTPVDEFLKDIEKNQATLKSLGLPASRHFAYPFGHVSPALKRALGQKFETLRGVVKPGLMGQDAHLLNAVRIYSGSDIDTAFQKIKSAKAAPQWLHFYTHDVRENPSAFGCTPAEFGSIIAAVEEAGFPVMTVDAAFQALQQGGS